MQWGGEACCGGWGAEGWGANGYCSQRPGPHLGSPAPLAASFGRNHQGTATASGGCLLLRTSRTASTQTPRWRSPRRAAPAPTTWTGSRLPRAPLAHDPVCRPTAGTALAGEDGCESRLEIAEQGAELVLRGCAWRRLRSGTARLCARLPCSPYATDDVIQPTKP